MLDGGGDRTSLAMFPTTLVTSKYRRRHFIQNHHHPHHNQIPLSSDRMETSKIDDPNKTGKVRVPRKPRENINDLLTSGYEGAPIEEVVRSNMLWFAFLAFMFIISFEVFIYLAKRDTSQSSIKSEF